MKSLKDLIVFLILEVGSVVWAGVSFTVIPSKLVAGAAAGGFFVIFSLYIFYRILRWPKWWEAWCLYPLLIFLFGCSIPMLWERFGHTNRSFSDVRIWGIPGPEFHHISAAVLGLLILVTLAETVSVIFRGKASSKN